MIAELERRTRQMFVHEDGAPDSAPTHLDYVEMWVASGQTLNRLAFVMAQETGDEAIVRAMLSKYLTAEFENAQTRLEAARREGAHAMAEDTMDIADEIALGPMDVGRQRNRIAARQWYAEKSNRAEFGQSRPGITVELNVRELHLSALRAHSVSLAAGRAEQQAISATSRTIDDTIDAEMVVEAIA